MDKSSCSRCGYALSASPCPICGGATQAVSGPRTREGAGGPLLGLHALLAGGGALLVTRGTKRWLLPPFALTLLLAAWLHARFGARWTSALFDLADPERVSEVQPAWLRTPLGWIAGSWWLGALESVSRWLVLVLIVWVCLTFAYEAIAGPFLDEVHGRLEARWLGQDPLADLARPDGAATRAEALRAGLLLGPLLLAAGIGAWWLASPWPLAIGALPPLLLGLARPRFGRWLRWVAGREGRLLALSALAAGLALAVTLLALPLLLLPVVGTALHLSVAGCALAFGALDPAFSRRGWGLRRRMRFGARHALPLAGLGIVTGFLSGIPFLGPLLAVPLASAGGLWLLVALDTGGPAR